MNKYFFYLKKERHLMAAQQEQGKQCPKCERWGFFCKCE